MDKSGRKPVLLFQNKWLLLFLAAVLLATVGSVVPIAAFCSLSDGWTDSILHFMPFFKMLGLLSWIFSNSLAGVDPFLFFVIPYYALWGMAALSVILAVKKNQAWKYVLYVLFAADAWANLIFPNVTVVIDIAMVVLFLLAQKENTHTGRNIIPTK